MLNRLLLEFYKSPNNGRQIATLPGGRRLLLVHSEVMGPATISLKVSRDRSPARIDNFVDLGRVAGPESIVSDSGPWGFGGSLTAIGEAIHVAWSGPHGIQYCSAVIQDNNLRAKPAQTILEGDYRLGDIVAVGKTIALTYHQVHDRRTESVGLAWLDGRRWRRQEVSRGKPMFAPVMDVDESGQLHLVWGNTVEQLHYARLSGLGEKPEVRIVGDGIQPSIISAGKQQLIVNEDEYGHIRYYTGVGSTWKARGSLTISHPWLTPDQLHSPQLSRDRHGVVWLFFADSTRRCVHWSRWLGDSWSPVYNGPRLFHRSSRFDSNLLPPGRLSVEKHSRPRSSDIGMIISAEPPVNVVEFRREAVPKLNLKQGRKVLFLDLLEVARTENVAIQVETAKKHKDNPLMELGAKGSFDEDRVFNHGTVMLDDGKYRMWYGGVREHRRGEPYIPWWDTIRCGYAESDDGIHWKRVKVGLVNRNASTDNNIVPYFRHAPVMIKDDADPDPARRYKGFYFWNSGEHLEIARTGKYGKTYDPRDEKFLMDLFTSPDGIHLKRIEGEVLFPGLQAKPFSTIPQSAFRDDDDPDPQKRYKAYGFMSLNLRRRGTSYLYSPDCVHWTAHPEMPVIDPAVRGVPPAAGGPTGQVHDTICFQYEGYYIALYQDQHEPRNMPVELAVSRDAESFRFVMPGSKVIPVGSPDAWDALTILPTMPIILENEIRLYYGGGIERRKPDGQKMWDTRPGLATLRRDGFTTLRLANSKRGSIDTIPFELPRQASTLHLNVRCPKNAEVRAELLDAETDKPLPGFSIEECKVIIGDHLDTAVSWNSTTTLPIGSRPVRLKLTLVGNNASPELYAFWLREEA